MDRREVAAAVSLACNALLVALKLAGAGLSGSVALLADAWHSASDIAVSLLVWAGVRMSGPGEGGRRETGVIENGIAILISVVIFYAAYAVSRKAVTTASEIRRIPAAMAITLLCILISFFISRYKMHIGRETHSPSLIADGQHSRMDMYTSVAVLFVLMGSMIGIPIDAMAAVCISLAIVKVGIEVLSLAIRGLRRGEVLRLVHSGAPWPEEGKQRGVFIGAMERLAFSMRRRRRLIATSAIIAAAAVYMRSGVCVVGPAQKGLLTRFGRFVGELREPGMHLHWPYPVESVIKMEPEHVRRLEFGFRTVAGFQPQTEAEVYDWGSRHQSGRYRKQFDEALMLTGDENIIDINLILHYRVRDMRRYLIGTADPERLVRAATESCATLIVGSDELDHILTTDRAEVEARLREAVQGELDRLGLGMEVVRICLQDVHPPIEIVSAFREVASAREDKDRMINEAAGRQNDAIPRARGKAAREVADAEAYRRAKVEHARGEASYYLAVLEASRQDPGVTRTRLVWEGLEKALKPARKFFVGLDGAGEPQLWIVPAWGGSAPFAELMKEVDQ